MKNLKSLLLVFVVLVSVQTAFSQRKLTGKVVEVLDGRTAVVEIGTDRKLTVVLQYVEVPEPEQPLYAVVKEHFSKLLLGKNAVVVARGIGEAKSAAQIFVDGVDVSQQMIRDGAAWFALPEKTEKSGAEIELYLSNEAQAKAEKRGVWSIENMKPAWQFRADKEARLKAEETARIEEITRQNKEKYMRTGGKKLPPPPAVFSNFEMWQSGRTAGMWDEMQMYMADQQFDENGLFKYKAPNINIAFIITKDAPINISNGNSRPKVICGVAYVTGKGKDAKEEKEFFGMGCRAESDKQSFKNSNGLTFTTDGKKLSFGKAIHLGQQTDKRFNEMMVFFLDRNAFTKIAAANNVQIKIGDYSGTMSANFHTMIKHLVLASANEIEPQTAKK